jgi:hypothetical protein
MLLETFSFLNIVERGKYSRGNCDSKPGFQAPYSAGSGSILMALSYPLVLSQNEPRPVDRLHNADHTR